MFVVDTPVRSAPRSIMYRTNEWLPKTPLRTTDAQHRRSRLAQSAGPARRLHISPYSILEVESLQKNAGRQSCSTGVMAMLCCCSNHQRLRWWALAKPPTGCWA